MSKAIQKFPAIIGKNVISLLLIVGFTFFLTGCEDDDNGKGNGNGPVNSTIQPEDFLRADKYDVLAVEIQYMPGTQPTQEAKDNLIAMLLEVLNKPEGIVIKETEIPSGNDDSYSLEEIKDLEDSLREFRAAGSELTAYYIILDAPYSGNSGNSQVLGVAYRTTSMAIFGETIQNISGGLFEPSRATVETTVMNHEFGHILGLVNNGTPMETDHQDEAHGAHCDVEECLMYFQADNSADIENLMGGNIPELDSLCRADLRANGGK